MNAMAKEMMRAGMIEEMVDETMSSMEVHIVHIIHVKLIIDKR